MLMRTWSTTFSDRCFGIWSRSSGITTSSPATMISVMFSCWTIFSSASTTSLA